MGDTDVATDETEEALVDRDTTVLVRDLDVTYKVYEDRRPSLREFVKAGFRRPSYREIHAVRNVSFQAHRGEAIGIVGRNGSGKTTLLKAIAGVLPPTAGSVFATSRPTLLGVGAALQAGISGRRNILLGGLALGLSRAEMDDRIDDIVAFAGLEEFIDLPLRTYSSGMRARLQFAVATAVRPEILLIDEALAVGDELFKERSKERIDELVEDAGTVFLVSHSMQEIQKTCSRAVWLERGEIMQDGSARSVVHSYIHFVRKQREKHQLRQSGTHDADGHSID